MMYNGDTDTEDICPNCHIDISAFRRELKRRQLFEVQFGEQLRPGRILRKVVLVFLSIALGLFLSIFLSSTQDVPFDRMDMDWLLRVVFERPLVILFVFISSIMYSVFTKLEWFRFGKEKKLWQNFIKKYGTGN